jgi:hypothetical protein
MDHLRQPPQLSFAFDDPREVPCKRCGKLLLKKKGTKKSQYCDWACLTDLPKRDCEWCGVSFRARSFGTNQFCARPCQNAHREHVRDNPPHCRLPGCKKKAKYKREQLCDVHYWRRYRHGWFEPPPRQIDPMPMSPTDAAWLAGILDGEGCVSLNSANHGHLRAYFPRVSVTNTDLRMIEKIQEITGIGGVYYRPASGNWRERWHWDVQNIEDIMGLLLAVRPYLITKGDRADLLLTLPFGYERCPEKRREIYLALRKLNRRGNPDKHES